jgi:hypothetical protein
VGMWGPGVSVPSLGTVINMKEEALELGHLSPERESFLVFY